MFKRCTTCGKDKDVSEFYKDATCQFGVQHQCKACNREASRQWYRDNYRRAMLNSARNNARARGLSFSISVSDIPDLPTHCPVLGIELKVSQGGRNDHSPSLDRIDNLKGYDKGNIVIVSWRANRLKGSASCEELRMIADFYERNRNE